MNFKYANENLREIMISLRHLIIIINFDNFSCTQPLNVNHRIKNYIFLSNFLHTKDLLGGDEGETNLP